jgi:hypothetical protein
VVPAFGVDGEVNIRCPAWVVAYYLPAPERLLCAEPLRTED